MLLLAVCSHKPASVHTNVFAELEQVPGHKSSCSHLYQEGACYYSLQLNILKAATLVRLMELWWTECDATEGTYPEPNTDTTQHHSPFATITDVTRQSDATQSLRAVSVGLPYVISRMFTVFLNLHTVSRLRSGRRGAWVRVPSGSTEFSVL